MIEVHPRLHVGDLASCRAATGDWAIVHACKSPCHQSAVGYKGNLPKEHPSYLALRKEGALFLNLIDPPVPLFQLESFEVFLGFASEQWDAGKSLLIHCNQGESRAPSLALLLLAFRLGIIPNNTFGQARDAFQLLYPKYSPGAGIEQFLTLQWRAIKEL